eukprot:COSAG01_NODE_714_length_14097_cov_6.044435_9_plen_165_part_00
MGVCWVGVSHDAVFACSLVQVLDQPHRRRSGGAPLNVWRSAAAVHRQRYPRPDRACQLTRYRARARAHTHTHTHTHTPANTAGVAPMNICGGWGGGVMHRCWLWATPWETSPPTSQSLAAATPTWPSPHVRRPGRHSHQPTRPCHGRRSLCLSSMAPLESEHLE